MTAPARTRESSCFEQPLAVANYTLDNGLKVQPVYIGCNQEDGYIVQESCWANVTTQIDQAYVHQRIDIDVPQPLFRDIHYGNGTVDETSCQKRSKTMKENKEAPCRILLCIVLCAGQWTGKRLGQMGETTTEIQTEAIFDANCIGIPDGCLSLRKVAMRMA